MSLLDNDTLKSIYPEQLRAYLLQTGWRSDSKIGEFATVWHRPSESEFEYEVLLPERVDLRDYKDRVADAIVSISAFEKRTESKVLKDIANYFSDTVSIRVVHNDVENGTIPLEDGVKLFEKAKDLLSSAALSTISKKRYFFGSRPSEASNFLSKVRLGQTEIGSYVVNVVVPLDTQSINDLIDRKSFSRHVTTTLGKGLSSLKTLTESPKSDSKIFEALVSNGVSANMCDALVGLSGEKRNRGFDIGVSFSASEEIESSSVISYSFSSNDVPSIEKASEYLKENYVIDNATISGPVKKLDRAKSEEDGTVTIVAFVEDRDRAVSFELSSSEYHEAILAHDQKLIVEISGDIHIGPRSARMLNPHGFRVFGAKDIFE
ncbi:hypothetical protein [Marinimicrobium sp. ABcell2]|uniref:hypothetical protein n=1 Tax=Marinimicrobium sp. ABcell2 TaxID=3069751 RepID=UPI0027B719D6|nr:hypothetical protein [Marinimicrobium sp. ABcell2]MDQ2076378.1 hypothetical protein [Marinimicrobium sp. ABcell2]